MPTSTARKPSSKVRYAALFAGRCRTEIPFNIRVGSDVSVQDAVDKTIQNLLLRHAQQNARTSGIENVDQNVIDAVGNENILKDDGISSAIDSMPQVTLTLNRDRLKVKVTVDRKGRVKTNESMTSNGARQSSTRNIATIRQSTFRHRMRNVLLFARSSHPLLRNAVACVVSEGYEPSTNGWIHMLVYWLVDAPPEVGGGESMSSSTAAAELFLRHALRYIDTASHRERVRRIGAELAARGRLQPVPPQPTTPPHLSRRDDDDSSRRRSEMVESGREPMDVAVADELSSSVKYGSEQTSSAKSSLAADRQGRVLPRSTSDATPRGVYNRVIMPSAPVAATAAAVVVADGFARESIDRRRDIRTDGPPEPPFTADGMELDNADFVALRSRIARLSLMAAASGAYYNDQRASSAGASIPRPLSSNQYETFGVGAADPSQQPGSPTYFEQLSTNAAAGRQESAGPAVWTPPPPIAAQLSDEFRARLYSGSPILLPPKDYDTVNRQRGNMVGIETRRSQHENLTIVSSLF